MSGCLILLLIIVCIKLRLPAAKMDVSFAKSEEERTKLEWAIDKWEVNDVKSKFPPALQPGAIKQFISYNKSIKPTRSGFIERYGDPSCKLEPVFFMLGLAVRPNG